MWFTRMQCVVDDGSRGSANRFGTGTGIYTVGTCAARGTSCLSRANNENRDRAPLHMPITPKTGGYSGSQNARCGAVLFCIIAHSRERARSTASATSSDFAPDLMDEKRPPAPDEEAPLGTDDEAPPATEEEGLPALEEVAAPVPKKEASDASLIDSYFYGLQRRVDRILKLRPRPPAAELAKLQTLFIELARPLHSAFKRAPEQPERATAVALDYLFGQAARVSYYLPELRNAIIAELNSRSRVVAKTIPHSEPAEAELGAESLKRPTTKKPGRRRTPKNEAIDAKLLEVEDARPKSYEELCRLLDREGAPIPDAEPFKSARGWLKGFYKNPAKARSWLSDRRRKLRLRPFAPGPKKKL